MALIGADYLLVREGLDPFDPWLILVFRVSGDPGQFRGPLWLAESARDLTAIGSNGVAGLVVFTAGVGFVLARRPHQASVLVAATIMALVLNAALKIAVHRARPDLVPGAPTVFTTSFPSSHAMVSAAMLFALAHAVGHLTRLRGLRIFAFVMAGFGTALVGFSRIYLGVHWPTDVIGGWTGGLFCAWAAAWLFDRRDVAAPPTSDAGR